jgi:hypothetical protein
MMLFCLGGFQPAIGRLMLKRRVKVDRRLAAPGKRCAGIRRQAKKVRPSFEAPLRRAHPSRVYTHGRPRPVDDQLRMLPAHGISDVAAEAQRQRCLQRFWQPLGWDLLPLGG